MTAKEKFEARLNELGLANQWKNIGQRGRVACYDDTGGIVLLIHEDDADKYSEIWYPPFNELRKNPVFCDRLKENLHDLDPDTQGELAMWLLGVVNDCPLDPVDVYWPGDGMSDHYEDFEDDPDEDEVKDKEEEAYQEHVERMERFASWMDTTLAYIRRTLLDAVKIELARGHNLYDNFRIEGDCSHFADYYMDYVREEKVVLADDRESMYIQCVADGETFNIPFYLLTENEILHVYNSMK